MIGALTDFALLLLACYLLRFLCYEFAAKDFEAIQETQGQDVLRSKWHRQGWLKKAASAMYCGMIFSVAASHDSLMWLLVYLVAFLLFAAAAWWLCFDLELNRLRGLHPFYIGVTSKLDLFLCTVMGKEIRLNGRLIKKRWNHRQTHLRVKVPLIGLTALILIVCILIKNL